MEPGPGACRACATKQQSNLTSKRLTALVSWLRQRQKVPEKVVPHFGMVYLPLFLEFRGKLDFYKVLMASVLVTRSQGGQYNIFLRSVDSYPLECVCIEKEAFVNEVF